MNKRLFPTTLLSFALLFSQGGIVLIAALCPHLRTGVMRCDSSAQPVMDHHHMTEMKMDPDEMPFNNDGPAVDIPLGTCTHCVVHAKTTSGIFPARHREAAKVASDLTVPLVSGSPVLTTIQGPERLTARSHGPPGDTVSRYILIDVFRI